MVQLFPHNPPRWPEIFASCSQSAFHLEVRDTYAVPQESERFRRFLNGDPPLPDEYKDQWTDLMRQTTQRGVEVSRVRVVTVPHSDYQRWLLSVTASNVEAGEDIRYVPRHLVDDVPHDDWWLLDASRVMFNLVDNQGKPAGLAVTSDPGIVSYCVAVKDSLWKISVPFVEYANSVHS